MNDHTILRSLVEALAQHVALPIQEERRRLWRANNDLKPVRPMVTMLEIPWGEFERDVEALVVRCENPYLRQVERGLRQQLFEAVHMKTD